MNLSSHTCFDLKVFQDETYTTTIYITESTPTQRNSTMDNEIPTYSLPNSVEFHLRFSFYLKQLLAFLKYTIQWCLITHFRAKVTIALLEQYSTLNPKKQIFTYKTLFKHSMFTYFSQFVLLPKDIYFFPLNTLLPPEKS